MNRTGRDCPPREHFPVLVPDAQAIGMIGVIRSLGAAGYPVHAAAQSAQALGLISSFTHQAWMMPDYASPSFVPWLRERLATLGIRAIVPSEGFLLAVREHFEEFAPLMSLPQDRDHVYRCLSKSAVIAELLASGDTARHLPPTLLWSEGEPAPKIEALAALGLPLFVKGDGADGRTGEGNLVCKEDSATSALARVHELMLRYRRVLVQGFVPGQGTGAYVLVDQGVIVQEFMNRCLHEVPHTGGFCSLRESWAHGAMMEDARCKIRRLGWQGVAMLEYRWDPETDRFWFIELNARFWAALHVSLFAGVDFPLNLMDRFRGAGGSVGQTWHEGVQVRYTVPYEVGYVRSLWNDPDIRARRKLSAAIGFFLRLLDPRAHADLLFPGDRKLYFIQWARFVRGLLQR